jgi:hypothetical protein
VSIKISYFSPLPATETKLMQYLSGNERDRELKTEGKQTCFLCDQEDCDPNEFHQRRLIHHLATLSYFPRPPTKKEITTTAAQEESWFLLLRHENLAIRELLIPKKR